MNQCQNGCPSLWSSAQVANALGGILVGPDVPITGPVVTDSRQAGAGSLYIARRGECSDGHQFLGAAAARGAVAALVSDLDLAHALVGTQLALIQVADPTVALGQLARLHLQRLRQGTHLRVIGVTGSAGKTTTKDLLAQLLSGLGPTVAPQMSFNNEVGLPLTVMQADAQTKYLVLEMGASAPGDIAYLTKIAPLDVAVVLLVGLAHLGGFGSPEAVGQAKAEIIAGLVPGGVAVLNRDDELVWQMRQLAPGRVLSFSAAGNVQADHWAADSGLINNKNPYFKWQAMGHSEAVTLQLVGKHNIANALAAAAAAVEVGLEMPVCARMLSAATAQSPHRMDIRTCTIPKSDNATFTVIDDSYNANPDSMEAALRLLACLGQSRRKVAVLGAMLELGPSSDAIHKEVAVLAQDLGVDLVIAVGAPTAALVRTIAGHAETHLVDSASAALKLVDKLVRPDDVVLLKGSNGSEVYKIADELLERK